MIDLNKPYIKSSLLKIIDELNEMKTDTNEIKDKLLSIYQFMHYGTNSDSIISMLYDYKYLYEDIKLDFNKTCCFTGPRPDNLYGYDMCDYRYEQLLDRIIFVCEQLITRKDVCNFIVGGAQGFDTLAYLAVNKLKSKYSNIKLVMAVPYKDYCSKWPKEAQLLCKRMSSSCDAYVEVDKVIEYNSSLDSVGNMKMYKYQLRNKFMVNKSKYVCSSYSGTTTGGTFNCINYIRKLQTENKRLVFNINKETFKIDRLDIRW